MLRVNLATGETRSIDLDDAVARADWESFQASDAHQRLIRGITIAVADETGAEIVFAMPRPGIPVTWEAGLVLDSRKGVAIEYVTTYADRLAITMYVHRRHPLTARVLVERVGKLRIRPPLTRL